MGTIEADDGTSLWVERTGDGPGLPLVLCHGGPGLWDHLGPLAALLDHNRPVVRWDQRGCGRSGGLDGPFSVTQSLADLDAVRRHLGISRWIVGGHFWGAALALRAVLASPTSAAGLLHLSGTGLGRGWHPAYKSARAERLTPEQLARCDVLEALPNRTRAEDVEWRTLRWAPDFADRSRALELAAIDAAAPWAFNMVCNSAINAETRRWDAVTLLGQCATLDLRIIDDAGHTPWLERPGAVAAVLRPWVAKRV